MDELDDLDHAVAKALGGVLEGDGWLFPEPINGDTFIKTKRSFCRDWSYGGPIIERERITLASPHNDVPADRLWQAVPRMGAHIEWGPTPLVAAMRAFVYGKR